MGESAVPMFVCRVAARDSAWFFYHFFDDKEA